MHVIVAYDVGSDRSRRRLFERLKRWLKPVQKSVLEGPVSGRELDAVRRTIVAELDLAEDRARIVRLCPACRGRLEDFGAQPPPEDPDAPIVIG